jgi:hypothetical protein
MTTEKQIARLKTQAASYKRQFDLLAAREGEVTAVGLVNPHVNKYRKLYNDTIEQLGKLDHTTVMEQL